jgi:hypothetical protein
MYVGDDECEDDRCSDLAEMPPILGMRQFPVPASDPQLHHSIGPCIWQLHFMGKYNENLTTFDSSVVI